MTSSVGGTQSVPQVHHGKNATSTGKVTTTVGSGVNGVSTNGTMPAPEASVGYTGLMDFMHALMPKVSDDQVDVLLAEATTKLKKTEDDADKGKIQVDSDKKRAAAAEKEQKLKDAESQMQEAEKAKHSSNIFTAIKIAFQALAAVAMIAIGAALIATGVGVAAGVCLVASGVIAAVMTVDAIVQAATPDHQGIMGSIVKAAGGSDDAAKYADMGFGIAMAVASIVISVVSLNPEGMISAVGSIAGKLGGAAADALMDTGGLLTTASSTALKVGEQGAEEGASFSTTVGEQLEMAGDKLEEAGTQVQKATDKVVDNIKNFASSVGNKTDTASKSTRMTINIAEKGTGLVTDAGSTATDVGQNVSNYQATDATADAQKNQAAAKQFDALMKSLDDFIDMALKQLMDSGDRFAAMMDSVSDSLKDQGDTFSRMKFRG